MVAEPDQHTDFRALHDANRQRIRGLMARLAGPQEADDLTQVAFAKAAKALASLRCDAQASTWLYRIAVNVASDWLRSRARQEADATVPLPEDGEATPVLPSAADPPPSPEEELAQKDVNACIRNEIAKLSDAHRDVLMLSFLAGMKDEEIAHTLDISVANAKVRLHRARQEFRQIIAARCDFYSNELSCKPSSPDCCASQDTGQPAHRS